MNTRLAAVAATMLLVGTGLATGAVLLLDDSYNPVAAPQWASGQTFSYAVSGDVEFNRNDDGEIQHDADVLAPFVYNFEVYSASEIHRGEPIYIGLSDLGEAMPFANLRIALSGDGPAMSETSQATISLARDRDPMAFRQRDLANVPAWAEYDCMRTCEASAIRLGEAPAYQFLAFPLVEGKTWTDREGWIAGDEIEAFTVTGRSGPMQSIEVPAGRVDAVRITLNHRPVGLEEFEQEIRDDAELHGVEIVKLNLDYSIRQVVHYAPALQAIARAEVEFRGGFEVVAIDDGRQESHAGYVRATVVEELAGIGNDARPERSMDELLAAVSARAPIGNITPTLPHEAAEPDDDWFIQLNPSATAVNAADKPLVGFTTESSLPEGATLRYLVTRMGDTIDEGTAVPFSVQVEDAGVHMATVEAFDVRGYRVATDRVFVVANYDEASRASCTAGASVAGAVCGMAVVPAHGGVERVTVSTAVGDLDRGQLVVYDADGQPVDGDRSADGTEIEISDFGGARLSADTWSVEWEPQVGLSSSVQYDVSVSYREPTLPEPGGHQGPLPGPWLVQQMREAVSL